MFTRKESCWKLIKLVVRKYDITTSPLAHEARRATNREGGEVMRRRTQCKAASGGIKRLFQIMSWTAASFMLIAHIGIPEAHADGTWKFKKDDTTGVARFTGDGENNAMEIRSTNGLIEVIGRKGKGGTVNTQIEVDGALVGNKHELDPTTITKIVVKGRGGDDTVNFGQMYLPGVDFTIREGDGDGSVRFLALTADSVIGTLIMNGGPGTDRIMVENDEFEWTVSMSSIGGFEIIQQ